MDGDETESSSSQALEINFKHGQAQEALQEQTGLLALVEVEGIRYGSSSLQEQALVEVEGFRHGTEGSARTLGGYSFFCVDLAADVPFVQHAQSSRKEGGFGFPQAGDYDFHHGHIATTKRWAA